MKSLKIVFFTLLSLVAFTACEKHMHEEEHQQGSLTLEFENFAGTEKVELTKAGSTEYVYSKTDGQQYNISKLGYYITDIKLEGPEGEMFMDPVEATADEAKGYYHILEGDNNSRFIELTDIPAGKYDKITFTLGVGENGLNEGILGGVLDPAIGGWYWNWNAGYINFAVEGTAADSPQEEENMDGFITPAKKFELHVGGWKDIVPVEGQPQRFVNNLKTITLDMGTYVNVMEGMSPKAHIVFDINKVLDGAKADFAKDYAIHSPYAGQRFANQLEKAFMVHHIHQGSHSH